MDPDQDRSWFGPNPGPKCISTNHKSKQKQPALYQKTSKGHP